MTGFVLPAGPEGAGGSVERWRGVRTAYPAGKTIPQLFAAWASRRPAAPAVRDLGRELTYSELDEWSDRVAWALLDAGVPPGEPVGLLGQRCLEAPVGALAIMKAGGAYVPLDPADPAPRRRELVRELGISRAVALPGHASDLGGLTVLPVGEFRRGPGRSRPEVPVRATDPAYVLFTSGATGVPKAVAVAHRSVARLVIDTDYVAFGPDDRVAATGYLPFDASVFEFWGALLNGGCLVVVDQDTLLDATRMHRLLVDERIDVLWLSAGVFHHLARVRPDMFQTVGFLISGGDVLSPEAVREVLRAGGPGRLVNGYGPTENTTFSATYRITHAPPDLARIPIGRPIANSTCYVVTDEGALAETGQEGELWVGGDGVALGYVNDPELTARRFVPDRFGGLPGGRAFRTGDRARWLPDGTLEFLGRRDRMVKVRDFRIELDEIEAALRGCPGVGDAAVVVAESPGGKVIEAFYTSTLGAGTGADPGRLRTALGGRLPAYMLPGRYVPVPRMPLTASGKVDRNQLGGGVRLPAVTAPTPPGRAAAPIEAGLAHLWEEVLGVDRVAAEDDFFELGGNSLLAATIFARLRTLFGVGPGQSRFLTRRLLTDPSLRACALAVQEARDETLTRDDAGDDIDWWRAASVELPRPAVAARTVSPVPEEILLTGASGFLGTYLLRRLLEHTDARVHCLVRAGSDEQAQQRLVGQQLRYGLGDLPTGRVVALAGDLGQPALGWAAGRFSEYGRFLDAILHAGAYVNFTYPYAHLGPVTVGGTVELIRLAAAHRSVPLHFVSTLAVLAGFGAAGVRLVDEDTELAFPEHLYMGYTETKWVAERILSRARAEGLPVAVHRPYEISGDLISGAWNLESATCALFKVIVDSGLAPDIDLALDLIPVDVLAAQIIHIVMRQAGTSRTYHLSNPAPATLRDMVARLRARGYRIRTAPFEDWVPQVVRFACDRPDHPFAPFLPLWVDRCPRNGLVLKEMFFAEHFPDFGRAHARAALADAEIRVPPVDSALLDHYIDFFQQAGFLGPASAR
ncbi:thioester reductase [Actinoplanes sp. ATCC 53533]|uniref:amino acid adenylation domain-containing SDR family oxidoreductase n=1 Tax=Actinoplanes sp. ATCC 53533 TaxID=1288362 RepID=UPI000F78EAB1|nr:amino acid adenylation domain-containing SDR family oxidoreductase [Actinoplanes sp. ATCC 53533]RSM69500.1 thioester reductase [Actinoplanes sp. ATCC 53533]